MMVMLAWVWPAGPGETVSILIFVVVIGALYGAEAWLIIGAWKNRAKGAGAGKRFWSKGAICVHAAAIIGLVCFGYGFFIEPGWIEVSRIEVPTEKLHGATVRVVQISDTHCGRRAGNEEKVVKLVKEMKADVVVFTGDAVNNRAGLRRFKDMMSRLEGKVGKFAVRGNFDTREWRSEDLFGGTGFTELDANSVEVEKDGERFRISGVSCERTQEYERVLRGAPADRLSIFIYHYPDLAEDMDGLNVDLYLCGHTHGGQIALPFYGAIITLARHGKKYEAGPYKVGEMLLYVNRGIGLDAGIAPRARFFARPEITVFDIRPR